MTDLHPITPPPELVQQWIQEATGPNYEEVIATRAAQWGADQELEACCLEIADLRGFTLADKLRAARRPKSPSLKGQALEHLQRYASGQAILTDNALDDIRRALEALPND